MNENTPSPEIETKTNPMANLPFGLDGLIGLIDLSFKKPVGLKLIPLFYILFLVGQLYTTLRISFALMDLSVSKGLWSLLTGLALFVIMAIGLRIILEALGKYLASGK